jgi:hypothetical protein
MQIHTRFCAEVPLGNPQPYTAPKQSRGGIPVDSFDDVIT